MFRYIQDSGKLWYVPAVPTTPPVFIGFCYSGHGPGINDPKQDAVHDVGPIPAGRYKVAGPITGTNLGPYVFSLTPEDPVAAHGRSGFFLHWDNARRDETASSGCIVPWLAADTLGKFRLFYLAGINELEVLAYPPEARAAQG